MTELKTLKDFIKTIWCEHLKDEFRPDVNSDELKTEAIKWVKELGTKKYNESGYPQARINIKWIKYFFNITEEDLKDVKE